MRPRVPLSDAGAKFAQNQIAALIDANRLQNASGRFFWKVHGLCEQSTQGAQ